MKPVKSLLVSGFSDTGKTMSLRALKNPERILYLNADAGKTMPFIPDFKEVTITDPLQLYRVFSPANLEKYDHIIVDTITFLMNRFETMYVNDVNDSRTGWKNYAEFWKKLMQEHVANLPDGKRIIFIGHTSHVMNKEQSIMETKVKFKGSLMNEGVESWFGVVVGTKRVPISLLDDYQNDLLNITDEEATLGYKYVIQTIPTLDTITEKIRAPLNFWGRNETFIDSNLQLVLDRMDQRTKNPK